MTTTTDKAGRSAGAAIIDLGDRQRVCVHLGESQGRPLVNTQLQVFDEDAGEWVPRRGLTLPPETAAAVARAMLEAAASG